MRTETRQFITYLTHASKPSTFDSTPSLGMVISASELRCLDVMVRGGVLSFRVATPLSAERLEQAIKFVSMAIFIKSYMYWRLRQLLWVHPKSNDLHNIFLCLVHHCLMSLGLEDGRIQDGAMSASSVYNSHFAAKFGRLNLEARSGNAGAWCVRTCSSSSWLQIDLGSGTTVTKVTTQGRHDTDQWVTTYAISYSPAKSNWVYVKTHGKRKVNYALNIKVGWQ